MSMFKDFLMKQMLKRQLKDMPKEEQEKIIKIVTANPKLFEQIAKEIQIEMKHGGKDQVAASMTVMKRHQAELQKILGNQ